MHIFETKYTWAYDPGRRSETRYLILHHAAGEGPVEAVHRSHLARGWAGIAYHYYVRKDGAVYRGRPEAWNGGHARGYNCNSIGICFEGNFEQETMSEEQFSAGRELVAEMIARYPEASVLRHCDLNATACPGRNFPFYEMIKEDETVPNYKTLTDVPACYRPAIRRLMERGALVGRSDPDPEGMEDNVLDLDETYCRVMATLNKLGIF